MNLSNIKKKILFVMSVIVCVVLLIEMIPLFEHVNKEEVSNSNNWMSTIDDSKRLSDINIPGTHDSATQYIELPFFSRCQDLSIQQQLSAGIRYLDIRLAISGEKLKLMHDFTHASVSIMPFSNHLLLDDVLEDCYEFLEKNPTETIVFVVRHEYGNESKTEFQKILNAYIQENRENWYLGHEIPILKEARGKIVLMRRYEDEAHLMSEAGLPIGWGEDNEFFKVASYTQFDSYSLIVQDLYDRDYEEKWKAFSLLIDYLEKENTDDICINFLSTKGSFVVGHPYYYAHQLNRKFMNRKLHSHQKYGWIILDFADAKLARHIYESNG